ncbi:MAG TPA: hypothetical protein VF796_21770 [Humisphaera sp.]
MHALPSPNGSTGRGAGGRFAAGNPGGPGNPFAKRAAAMKAAMKAAMYDAVTDEDVAAIVRGLVGRARAGDTAAAKEVLDRVLGRPLQGVALDARVGVGPDDPDGPIPTSGPAMAIRLMRIYARMGLPRPRWGPMVEEPYVRWLRGEDAANRPADFDAVAREVGEKCDVRELRRPDDGGHGHRAQVPHARLHLATRFAGSPFDRGV